MNKAVYLKMFIIFSRALHSLKESNSTVTICTDNLCRERFKSATNFYRKFVYSIGINLHIFVSHNTAIANIITSKINLRCGEAILREICHQPECMPLHHHAFIHLRAYYVKAKNYLYVVAKE